MMHYWGDMPMMGSSMLSMFIIWLLWFAAGSYVFSWIFWTVHNQVAKKK